MSKYLDPYLREFLFKFYHGRLFFKRYRLVRDDILNPNTHQCNLCKDGIGTPKHLFHYCRIGKSMRTIRNKIIRFLNLNNVNISMENLIYANFEVNQSLCKTLQMLIALSNYIMYTNKMKNFYNIECEITPNTIKYSTS